MTKTNKGLPMLDLVISADFPGVTDEGEEILDKIAAEIGEPFEPLISRVCECAVASELDGCDGKIFGVGLSLTNDAEIRRLNKKFRGIDRPTDVLSFPANDALSEADGGYVSLGDIVISLDRARTQAAEYGHGLKRELCFLTAHSMLHLFGYDHESPQDEAAMFAKQETVLANLGIRRA